VTVIGGFDYFTVLPAFQKCVVSCAVDVGLIVLHPLK